MSSWKDYDYDVIVIGGGISGLTAAYNLLQRDPLLGVLVLEANDTVGGRTKPIAMASASGNPAILDAGGHFVSKRQSHLMALLAKLGLETIDYDFPGNSIVESKLEKAETIDKSFLHVGKDTEREQLLNRLTEQISLENPMSDYQSGTLDSTTMEEYITKSLSSETLRRHFRNIVRTTCGSEPKDISPLFYLAFSNSTGGLLTTLLRQSNGGKSSYINGGMQAVVEKLVSEIGEYRILTEKEVIKVSRSAEEVIIYTDVDVFKCRCAIIAIPPSELITMNFQPPLNKGKINALKRMKGKRWMKFLATYKEQFWSKNSSNGDVLVNSESKKRPVVIILNISTPQCPALMGLVDLKRVPPTVNHEGEVLPQLAKHLGPEAGAPLDYFERQWPERASSEAAWLTNPAGPGAMPGFHEIRRPIGRLYFAGAETATYWYGHVGGAVQAGLRAAMEVLYEIRPQALRYEDFVELKPRRQVVDMYREATTSMDEAGAFGIIARALRLQGVITTAGGLLGYGRNENTQR